jgi:hypothetical protein
MPKTVSGTGPAPFWPRAQPAAKMSNPATAFVFVTLMTLS